MLCCGHPGADIQNQKTLVCVHHQAHQDDPLIPFAAYKTAYLIVQCCIPSWQ